MSHVLLTHENVRCALPAVQVLRGARGDEEPAIHLFGGAAGAPGARALLVDTAVGRRRLSCSETRFGALPDEVMLPLPEILVQCLAMPHVVGLAWQADDPVWLVDLARWEDR